MTFIDLDDILLDDHEVQLGGVIYRLPGDLPIEQMLGLSRAWERMAGGVGADGSDGLVQELYDRVLELFQVRQPELQELSIGVLAVARLIVRLYGDLDDEPAAVPGETPLGVADPPTTPRKGAGQGRGKTPTPRKPAKPRARSKASA